jgi:hypothetical protein
MKLLAATIKKGTRPVLEGSLLPACLTGNYLIDSSLFQDVGAGVRTASGKRKVRPLNPIRRNCSLIPSNP